MTRSIYYVDILIEQAKSRQDEMESLLSSLSRYKPQNKNKIKNRIETLRNAEKNFYGREMIINIFENGIFYCLKNRNIKSGQEKKTDKEEKEEKK